MKILYAVQATGNGHISRAMELLPYLQEYGSVDIFLSGDNSHLALDAPVKYRSKGISLYYNCKGGLDYWELIRGLQPRRVRDEIRDLPVDKYDLVLNDFDYITSAACLRKKVPSIHFGHQASFSSITTPRPRQKSKVGEWLLRNFVKSTRQIGFHFEAYDDFIVGAVVKKKILEATPTDLQHITVYLPSYCEPQLKKIFHTLPDYSFEIFSGDIKAPARDKNIRFFPVDRELFNESFISCHAVITGGGFETPAEALHLGKKIMAIPIRGQYEQLCNVAALQKLGMTCLPAIDDRFTNEFEDWIKLAPVIKKDYSLSIPHCMEKIFSNTDSDELSIAGIEQPGNLMPVTCD